MVRRAYQAVEPPTAPILRDGNDFEIDAIYLAEHFRLDPAEVPALLQNGELRSLCECGEGADAGHYRLSFRLGRSRLTLLVDERGTILRRTSVHFPG